MKKRIGLLIIFVISLFIFSGKVDAAAMYLQCNYADYCVNDFEKFTRFNGTWFGAYTGKIMYPGINAFVPLTDENGNVKLYGVAATEKGVDLFNLENEYENGDGTKGCWLKDKDGYGNKVKCNEEIAFGVSPQTMYITGTCPACMVAQAGANASNVVIDVAFPQIPGDLVSKIINVAMNNLFFVGDSGALVHDWEYVPVDKGTVVNNSSSYIEQTVYRIYKVRTSDNQIQTIAEGYIVASGKEGAYAYVGPNIFSYRSDDVMAYQKAMLEKQGLNFWRVHDNFESLMITSDGVPVSTSKGNVFKKVNVCKNGETDCVNNHEYELLIDSNDSNNKISESVINWYNDYEGEINELSGIIDVVDNKNLNNTSEELNDKMSSGKSFSFSGYKVNEFITDLEGAYLALEKFFTLEGFLDCGMEGVYTNDAVDSATSCLMANVIGAPEIKDLILNDKKKDSDSFAVNQKFLVEAIMRDVSDALDVYLRGLGKEDELNVIDFSAQINDYILKYFTSVSYLDSNPVGFGLSPEQSQRVSALRTKFEQLVRDNNLDIYPVVDCKGLLGQGLIDKINSYLDVIKIAIPIILIGFGVFDFTKAIFAGEDDMKKAQKSFFKRIFISLLIFLTPTVVNLILTLANKVWPIIVPDSCGIFQ